MNQYLEELRTWWNARQPRERQVLSIGAAFVAVAILYGAVWQPVMAARARAEQELRDTRAFANRLETIALDVTRARGAGGANTSLSLLSAVDQATRRPELGKEASRVQPEGDKEVKVWLDDVPFESMVAWLQQTQKQYGIVVSSAELDRKADGVVSARLSFTRP